MQKTPRPNEEKTFGDAEGSASEGKGEDGAAQLRRGAPWIRKEVSARAIGSLQLKAKQKHDRASFLGKGCYSGRKGRRVKRAWEMSSLSDVVFICKEGGTLLCALSQRASLKLKERGDGLRPGGKGGRVCMSGRGI